MRDRSRGPSSRAGSSLVLSDVGLRARLRCSVTLALVRVEDLGDALTRDAEQLSDLEHGEVFVAQCGDQCSAELC